MEKLRPRLTFANVMSCVALFVALGGSAYAATQLKKNSVGTKQLKKNSVTAAKIKKNAIVTAKLKNDAVTGAKVNTATLGTVPSAATAATFSGYSRKGMTRVVATAEPSFDVGLANAPQTPLLTAGPLTIYAQCFTEGTDLNGIVSIETSQNGAIFSSDNDRAGGDPFYLDTDTEAERRELIAEDTGPNGASFYGGEESEFAAMAPDGTTISGDAQVGVKEGTPKAGNGVYGEGDVCLFAGELTSLNG
jgi:hypothetical protein